VRSVIFIQARAGSRRLPGKHVADVCGKTLIARVIEASIRTGLPTVVSSNDEEILDIGKSYVGVEFALRRPDYLCEEDRWDDAYQERQKIHDYHLSAWSHREGGKKIRHITINGDTLIFNEEIIKLAVDLAETSDSQIVETAYPAVSEHPAYMMEIDKDGIAHASAEAGASGAANSKKLKPIYVLDAGVAVRTWPCDPDPERRILVTKKYDALSIHTQEDLELARALWAVKQGREHAPYASTTDR
jgi:CMP-N-acetylneuraminic acid synthetase